MLGVVWERAPARPKSQRGARSGDDLGPGVCQQVGVIVAQTVLILIWWERVGPSARKPARPTHVRVGDDTAQTAHRPTRACCGAARWRRSSTATRCWTYPLHGGTAFRCRPNGQKNRQCGLGLFSVTTYPVRGDDDGPDLPVRVRPPTTYPRAQGSDHHRVILSQIASDLPAYVWGWP